MAERAPFDEVLAIRYGSLASTRSSLYYRFHEYGEPDAPVVMDYYFWLLRRGSETVLVDTGFGHGPGVVKRGRTQHVSTRDALARLGVAPEAIGDVIVTHLHYDHTGNLDLFPHARLHVDARELEFWSGPYAVRPCFGGSAEPAELEWIWQARRDGRVTAIDADAEVLPGVRALRVGGHSPGQQILFVDTVDGEVVVASDAAHFYEELALDRPFDVFADLEAAYAALEILRRLQDEGRPVAVGHDPEVMRRFPAVSAELADLAVRIG
jgi:glyoxylase-like metal-dependent hydrolase (beta-lactamase superfamily II)